MISVRSFFIAASAAVLMFGTCASLQDAQARSIWEVLFGDHTLEPVNPDQKTPFESSVPAETQGSEMMDIFEKGKVLEGHISTLDIAQPHMSPEEVQDWTSGFIAQALSLQAETWDEDLKVIQPNFAAYGWKEYSDYLTRMNVKNMLGQNKMKMQAISDGPAQVLREGMVSGTYHWLVQVPVMVTFYKSDITSLGDKANRPGQNQRLIIQIQVGRTKKDKANIAGIEIERWLIISSK